LNIAFLLPNVEISGGIHVALSHAAATKRAGNYVTLVVVSNQGGQSTIIVHGQELTVIDIENIADQSFDLLVTTWWQTVEYVSKVNATKVINFIQSLEYRFYEESQFQYEYARILQPIPTATISVATWISDQISEVIAPHRSEVSLNGLSEAFLPVAKEANSRNRESLPLRILVEGPVNLEFKGVKRATEILNSLPFDFVATLVNTSGIAPEFNVDVYDAIHSRLTQTEFAHLLDDSDVLLKLSSVEGMFGPPLEAFARGCTVVCFPVTGHEEYVSHGVNALIASMNDDDEVSEALSKLHSDRGLLVSLQSEGIETARGWKTMEQSSSDFLNLAMQLMESAESSNNLGSLVNRLSASGVVIEKQSSKLNDVENQLGSAKEFIKYQELLIHNLEEKVINLRQEVEELTTLFLQKKYDATVRGTIDRILMLLHLKGQK
jgi:hypothetical protein